MSHPLHSHLEHREQIKPKEVVRIFLLQSASSEEITEQTDLQNFSFTRVVMIKKNEVANNPNQIMPIGGNVDKKETPEQTARREALEETHLIFSDLQKLNTTQEYTFQNKGKTESRKSHFFLGKLFSPKYDVPYALDNATDKIGSFVSLDIQSLQTLFNAGKLGNSALLDSLNTDEEVRNGVATVANQVEITAVQTELLEEVKKSEMHRKISVIKILIGKTFSHTDNTELAKQIEALKTFEEVETFWKANILQIAGSVNNLKLALRFSNIQDVLKDLMESKSKPDGKNLPTIQMMFPILFGFNFDKKLQPLLTENPHLSKLFAMSKILYLFNIYTGNSEDTRQAPAERLLRRLLKLDKGDEINEGDIIYFFQENNLISPDFVSSFTTLGIEVDKFFSDLQKQSKISPSVAYLSHSNEVENKDFERVIKLAFSTPHSKGEKQIKFEAQRKLLLANILFEAKRYYEKVTGSGIQALDDLEAYLETSDSSPTFGNGGRKISLLGQTYNVIIERRLKELNSILRKVLVRDDWDFTETSPYNDIYGETYIFDENAGSKMTEAKRKSPCKMTDSKNKPITDFTAPEVVYDFMTELVAKAKERGEEIEIQQWKGLPKNGVGMESNGIGGGGQIRLCKFYIKHTDKSGVSRMREVQMFLPNQVDGNWVSGKVDYDNKKTDDERYSISRLFTHGNVYSLIELLFPYDVYGDGMKEFFKI